MRNRRKATSDIRRLSKAWLRVCAHQFIELDIKENTQYLRIDTWGPQGLEHLDQAIGSVTIVLGQTICS